MKKILISFALLLFALPVQAAFDKDLYYGIQNDSDVLALQEFLTDEGIYSGPITGNFFSLTLKAVKSFQTREAISPVAGYFGPLTRAKTNAILSAQTDASNQQAVLETGAIPSPAPVPKTTNDVISKLQEQIAALLQQIVLLQQQASLQTAIEQKLTEQNQQISQQNQTIQQQQTTINQIQQNTQQIAQNTTPVPSSTPTLTPEPTPTPTPTLEPELSIRGEAKGGITDILSSKTLTSDFIFQYTGDDIITIKKLTFKFFPNTRHTITSNPDATIVLNGTPFPFTATNTDFIIPFIFEIRKQPQKINVVITGLTISQANFGPNDRVSLSLVPIEIDKSIKTETGNSYATWGVGINYH